MQARLTKAGYQTAAVGKLHLNPPTVTEAKRTGFDFVELHDGVSYLDRFSDYVLWRQQHDPQSEVPYRALAKNIKTGENPYRSEIDEKFSETTWVGKRTCHYLKLLAKSEKPFFLFSSFWKPHAPFDVCAPFESMYRDVTIPLPPPTTLEDIKRFPVPLKKLILRGRPTYGMDRQQLEWIYRSYYGTISHVDREIGRILDALQETGQAENTIVVFSSDHGDQLLEHGLMGKKLLFRGFCACSIYDSPAG